MSTDTSSVGSYRLEPLNATNWMPWKRRMLAILRDQGHDKYVTSAEKTKPVITATGASPAVTSVDVAAWETGEQKARTRIELAIGDTKKIHILGADTAAAIWERLCQVKETKGCLGVLATRRSLCQAAAVEGFDMVEHISSLRALQSELALMENVVSNEDFVMVLITSLPESWDGFTSAYLDSKSTSTSLSSSELIPHLLEEDRHCRGRGGDPAHSLQAKFKSCSNGGKGGGLKTTKECYNCGKKGHLKRDCWAKGGGREGKGPQGRGGNKSNQATDNTTDINSAVAMTYMARVVDSETIDTSKLVWHLDSGSTSHICIQKSAFTAYTPLHGATIQGVGPSAVIAEGTGSVLLRFKIRSDVITHAMRDVLYVPGTPNCLLSLSRFDDGGNTVTFSKGVCELRDRTGKVIGTGRKVNRLYELNAQAVFHQDKVYMASRRVKRWDEWHLAFGHIGMSTLERMQRSGIVSGFEVDESSIPSPTCTSCWGAKLTHQPFPKKAEERSRIPGEGYHCDVWGPIKTTSIWGYCYYISFTDDATRSVRLHFMKSKEEAVGWIEKHIVMVEQKLKRPPAWIRFDNGKELVNEKSKALCAGKGIEIHTTAPYSPSQNGVAERLNRTLLDLVRAMLIAKNLLAYLWDECIAHTVYLRNWVLVSVLPGMTPYEAYHGKKPDVSHLREFGCDVWVLDESGGRSKLDPKANKMVFVGFMDGSKSVCYYDPRKRNVKVSRDVAFNENMEERMGDIPGSGLKEELSVEIPMKDVDTTSGKDSYRDPQPQIPFSESEKSTQLHLVAIPTLSQVLRLHPSFSHLPFQPKKVPHSDVAPRMLTTRSRRIRMHAHQLIERGAEGSY
ncbi:hypothetical protein NMY22_g10432 [Coprinellus aureogranulatus]|nr:hypothetical protein NMY22_g10432 [Coprinellus aureogranulatus]